MNFAIKVSAKQDFLFCRAVAKSRHYEVLPQKCGALSARLIIWRAVTTETTERAETTERELMILSFVVVSFVSFVPRIKFYE